jgi:hypothetical protein
MTLKVGDKRSTAWSMFEVVDIGPGFDVGADLPSRFSDQTGVVVTLPIPLTRLVGRMQEGHKVIERAI